jgi:hypothetical protein
VARDLDFDDTIARVYSPNVIFNKVTGEEKLISSSEWRDVSSLLSKPGEWEQWEKRENRTRNSTFRYNIDFDGETPFQDAIRAAIQQPPETWQARAWKDVVHMCSTPEGARRLRIITARGHHPRSMREGFQILRDAGLIKYVPPLANFRPVYNLEVNPEDRPLDEAKSIEIRKRLDALERRARRIGPDARIVYAVYEFGDDSPKNVRRALKMIEDEVAARGKNPWPHVDVLLREIKDPGEDILLRVKMESPTETTTGVTTQVLTQEEFEEALSWGSSTYSPRMRACVGSRLTHH